MPKCSAKCDYAIPIYRDRANLMADTSTDDNPAELFTISVGSMPCTILTMGGNETYRGQQLAALISHIVETPWRTGVTADMRLEVVGGIYDGRILNIENVQPIRKGNSMPTLTLHCRETEP